MKPLAGTMLALAVAASSSLPPPALYHCPVSGKRNQPACCCRPQETLPSACCGGSRRAGPCHAGPQDGAAGLFPAPAPTRAVLRGTCCSVTREPRGAQILARDVLDSSWRSSLDGARGASFVLAALPLESSRSPGQPALFRPMAAPRERAGPALFILHRALLI